MPRSSTPGATAGCPTAPRRMESQVAQVAHRGVWEDLAGLKVTLAAQLDRPQLIGETLKPPDSREHLEALGNHFRADTVSSEHADLDQIASQTTEFGAAPIGLRSAKALGTAWLSVNVQRDKSGGKPCHATSGLRQFH